MENARLLAEHVSAGGTIDWAAVTEETAFSGHGADDFGNDGIIFTNVAWKGNRR
jgi:hypothetical protein